MLRRWLTRPAAEEGEGNRDTYSAESQPRCAATQSDGQIRATCGVDRVRLVPPPARDAIMRAPRGLTGALKEIGGGGAAAWFDSSIGSSIAVDPNRRHHSILF